MDSTDRVADATDHLIGVARCPIVADCLTGRTPDHPCAKLVLSQWPEDIPADARAAAWGRWHQLPEPWLGRLRDARLLFVASNPGLGGRSIPRERLSGRASDHLTTWEQDDGEIARRSVSGFENAALAEVPFWRDTYKLAKEAFAEDVVPGRDYALTEAVRCKSRGETHAVTSARGVCSRNYLHTTIVLSGARVILGLGSHARIALTRTLQLEDNGKLNYHETVIGPRRFTIALLPHPNSRLPLERKTLTYALTPEQKDTIRQVLQASTK